jgi:hypothetical protein
MDLFKFMYSNGIGVQLASLYSSWASLHESLGNTKKADMIYAQGIEKGAQPLENLKVWHREFQARVARQLVGSMSERPTSGSSFIPDAPLEERSNLGDLRGVGRRQQAPHLRVGDTKLGELSYAYMNTYLFVLS